MLIRSIFLFILSFIFIGSLSLGAQEKRAKAKSKAKYDDQHHLAFFYGSYRHQGVLATYFEESAPFLGFYYNFPIPFLNNPSQYIPRLQISLLQFENSSVIMEQGNLEQSYKRRSTVIGPYWRYKLPFGKSWHALSFSPGIGSSKETLYRKFSEREDIEPTKTSHHLQYNLHFFFSYEYEPNADTGFFLQAYAYRHLKNGTTLIGKDNPVSKESYGWGPSLGFYLKFF